MNQTMRTGQCLESILFVNEKYYERNERMKLINIKNHKLFENKKVIITIRK